MTRVNVISARTHFTKLNDLFIIIGLDYVGLLGWSMQDYVGLLDGIMQDYVKLLGWSMQDYVRLLGGIMYDYVRLLGWSLQDYVGLLCKNMQDYFQDYVGLLLLFKGTIFIILCLGRTSMSVPHHAVQ